MQQGIYTNQEVFQNLGIDAALMYPSYQFPTDEWLLNTAQSFNSASLDNTIFINAFKAAWNSFKVPVIESMMRNQNFINFIPQINTQPNTANAQTALGSVSNNTSNKSKVSKESEADTIYHAQRNAKSLAAYHIKNPNHKAPKEPNGNALYNKTYTQTYNEYLEKNKAIPNQTLSEEDKIIKQAKINSANQAGRSRKIDTEVLNDFANKFGKSKQLYIDTYTQNHERIFKKSTSSEHAANKGKNDAYFHTYNEKTKLTEHKIQEIEKKALQDFPNEDDASTYMQAYLLGRNYTLDYHMERKKPQTQQLEKNISIASEIISQTESDGENSVAENSGFEAPEAIAKQVLTNYSPRKKRTSEIAFASNNKEDSNTKRNKM